MCATQTGYKSMRGRNSQRTFPVHPYAAAYTIDMRKRDKEREKRKTAWQSYRGEKKVTRDLEDDEDRANNPALYRSLAVSLRIVNRRCQEIRERFEARLLKHPSFGCLAADSRPPRIIMSMPDYTCLDIVRRTFDKSLVIHALMYSANYSLRLYVHL